MREATCHCQNVRRKANNHKELKRKFKKKKKGASACLGARAPLISAQAPHGVSSEPMFWALERP